MATVSSLGVGSGLDLNGLLTKLMQIEQQPVTLLKQQQSSYTAKISAFGTISSKLSALQTAANAIKTSSSLELYQATSSDSKIATGKASTGIAAGTYNIRVTNLAQAHTLVSSGVSSATGAIDTSENTGTLRIGVAGSTFDVAITAGNNSLNGIRDAINSAGSNTGVLASVVTDTSGSRLVLTAKNTGAANTVTVAVDETGGGLFTGDPGAPAQNANATGLSKLAFIGATSNLGQTQAARDAALTINSVPISSASNTVSGAVTGLTVTLAGTGDVAITASRDGDSITKLINTMVSAFNDTQSTIRSLSAYDSSSKTSNTLTGDSAARGLIGSLNKAIQTVPSTVTGSFRTLADLGISLSKEGSLSVDSTKLQAAMAKDFDSVKSVVSGYATAIAATTNDATSTSGVITSRVNGLNSSVKLLAERAEALQRRLVAVEARYRRQFTALDSLVSQMNQTGSYLAQQLAKL